MDGSNKLKIEYVKRFFDADLSSKEFDFLMYLALRQDNKGTVYGVYYKDACEKLSISAPEFYKVLRSLKRKGFVDYEKNNRIDWDITLVNNRFDYDGAFKEGYVKISKLFEDKKFQELKAGAKILALDFIRLSAASGCSVKLKVATLRDKYTKLLRVQARVLKIYVHQIRKFFAIYNKDGLVFITPYKKDYENRRSENENCHGNLIDVICRRNRIEDNGTKHRKSVQELLNQYKAEAIECGERIERVLEYCVTRSLEYINVNNKKKREWQRILRPKLIHKLLRQYLQLDNMGTF